MNQTQPSLPRFRASHGWCGLVVCLLCTALSPTEAATAPIDFTRHIRPILSDHCFSCHGPDDSARKGKLRLDQREAAFRGGESGVAGIVAGQPEASAVIQRILTADEDDLMPPPKSKKPLSLEQKALLQRWVAEGAPWQQHWAFEKPVRPAVPTPARTGWVRNEIDAFVLARLEKEGLAPTEPADRPTLIRRASLDLTGLPPSVAEVDAFLQDARPEAYDKLVERLMTSERYGEHQAKYWMDAVRYADSHGYHIDSQRDIWPYRDWVIQAFNRNLSFDQFTVQQLGGDLLPGATVDQKVASGYVRCNMSTGEGGVIEAEYQAKYGFDRTETTGTVWMGLTLVCARCHTHKYDPITHKEYYGLYSFFNQLNEPVMDGNKPNPDPYLTLPSPEQKARQDALKKFLDDGQKKTDGVDPVLDAAQIAWQSSWHERLQAGWTLLTPQTAEYTRSETGKLSVVGPEITTPPEAGQRQTQVRLVAPLAAGTLGALRLDLWADTAQASAAAAPVSLAEFEADWIVPATDGAPEKRQRLKWSQVVGNRAVAGQDAGKATDANPSTAWQTGPAAAHDPSRLLLVLSEPTAIPSNAVCEVRLRLDGFHGPGSAMHLRLAAAQDPTLLAFLHPAKDEPWRVIGPFATGGLEAGLARVYPPEEAIDLNQSYQGVRDQVKWTVRSDLVDGRTHLFQHELHGVHGAFYFHRVWHLSEARPISLRLRADDVFKVWVNGRLVLERNRPAKLGEGSDKATVMLSAGENRILIKVVNHQGYAYFAFAKDLGDAEPLPGDIAALLAVSDGVSEAGSAKLRPVYRRRQSPEFKELYAQLDEWRAEQTALERAIPTTLVAREAEQRRDTVMFMRGEYDKPGDKVPPAVPSILPSLGPVPTNRLGLAQWLVHPEHPLTARVTVNRLWQQVFGVGLVKTSDDFGVQGEKPSHPELLDWLATEFVRTGWDVKRLLRLYLTSATYQQASRWSPELRQRDPENRLLARGPRFRLEAEALRDGALAMSGLLVERRGGRSVKPYEPPGLWEAVSYNNAQKYVPETGEGQYRRSLYTYWKRQSPPPSMLLFDAPTREYCVVRRPRTNTPLQALALLNDPQWIEASRGLAHRVLTQGGVTLEERLIFAFRTATARRPSADEIKILRRVYDEQLAEFQRDETAADRLLQVGAFRAAGSYARSELAAWTAVANMLLNLDESVTKG